jgi:hypothetical protein
MQANADLFFKNLFKNADSDSLFLFVDNRSRYASDWFDRVVREYNLSTSYGCLNRIKKSDKHGFLMEEDERVQCLEPYYSKYSQVGEPKRSAPVDLRIYRKA